MPLLEAVEGAVSLTEPAHRIFLLNTGKLSRPDGSTPVSIGGSSALVLIDLLGQDSKRPDYLFERVGRLV
jgi:hypothetical protein